METTHMARSFLLYTGLLLAFSTGHFCQNEYQSSAAQSKLYANQSLSEDASKSLASVPFEETPSHLSFATNFLRQGSCGSACTALETCCSNSTHFGCCEYRNAACCRVGSRLDGCCPSGTTCCGDYCCVGGEQCVGGTCQRPSGCDPGYFDCNNGYCCVTGSRCCGLYCCINGGQCVGGTCQSVDSCDPGYFDCNNGYCCQTGSRCCGKYCCINGATCQGGTCRLSSGSGVSMKSEQFAILALMCSAFVIFTKNY